LPRGEVHVWRVALELSRGNLDRLQQTLSADEQSRAARFRFPRDQRHFVAARGALRTILGTYLAIEPSRLRFLYSPFGKPHLDAPWDWRGLRFNLAHSDGLALVAVTRDRDVGIDLERSRTDFPWEGIAARFFSPREIDGLGSLPPASRCAAFFSCWSRKEAYVKARGEGLLVRLDHFDVSVAPEDPPSLLNTYDDPPEAARWGLKDLAAAAGYAAALVARGQDWRLQCWQWDGGSLARTEMRTR
jgi:4'-phosphopantetheinyl transferase